MTDARNIMLGTAGHVDHGKTALVKLLTGCETDRLADEKKRGLTIELGFAPCTMADERIVGVVDVPGHRDFIRNMVAGAHGVDVVIFVIAADDGVMPQTREHLDILTLMGCRRGLVALTKIDLVDAELRQLAAEEIRGFLAGTFLAEAAICPVSNVTGEGFDALLTELNRQVAAVPDKPTGGLFRLWVERAFRIAGFGTVVSGIPSAGQVRQGEHVLCQPGGLRGRVRKLQVYGRDAALGRAGECVALNIDGIDYEALTRGVVLAAEPAPPAVRFAEAELTVAPAVPRPLDDYAEVHVHVGTAETMCHLAILDAKNLPPGKRHLVQLRLAEAVCLSPGERFVIRGSVPALAGGRLTTLGGGRILAATDKKLKRNRPWTLEWLSARAAALSAGGPTWTAQVLDESDRPMTAERLAAAAGQESAETADHLAELAARSQVARLGPGLWVSTGAVSRAGQRIHDALDAFHQAHPRRLGMAPHAAAEQADVAPELAEPAVRRLVEAGRAQWRGGLLAIPGAGAQVSAEDIALAERLVERLSDAGLAPPLPVDLAGELSVSLERLTTAIRLLDDQDQVVWLDRKVVMHASAVARAQQVALDLFARQRSFETAEFRDALGVSRKYALALLDYFDTIRFTHRSANRRTPGAVAKERLAELAAAPDADPPDPEPPPP